MSGSLRGFDIPVLHDTTSASTFVRLHVTHTDILTEPAYSTSKDTNSLLDTVPDLMYDGPEELSPLTEAVDASPRSLLAQPSFQVLASDAHSTADGTVAKFTSTKPTTTMDESSSTRREDTYTPEERSEGAGRNWIHIHSQDEQSHPFPSSKDINCSSLPSNPAVSSLSEDAASHIDPRGRAPSILVTQTRNWSEGPVYISAPTSAASSAPSQRYMPASYDNWNPPPLPSNVGHAYSENSPHSHDQAPSAGRSSPVSHLQYTSEAHMRSSPAVYRSAHWGGLTSQEETTSLPMISPTTVTEPHSSGGSTAPSPALSAKVKIKVSHDKSRSPKRLDRLASSERAKRKASSGISPPAGTGESGDDDKPKRRGKLPKETTDMLKRWLLEHENHPYPSEEEKKEMCRSTGLHMTQLSNWFINARRRILTPGRHKPQGHSSSHGPPPRPSSSTAAGVPVASSHAVVYMPQPTRTASQYVQYSERHYAPERRSPYPVTAPPAPGPYSVPQPAVEQSHPTSYGGYTEYRSPQAYYVPSPHLQSTASTQMTYSQGGGMPSAVQGSNDSGPGSSASGSFASYSTPLLPNQGYASPVPPSVTTGVPATVIYQPQPQPRYYGRDEAGCYPDTSSR